MWGPCGLIINISITTRSAEHISFMANIDRMIVHNIVIFSDTSYHTIHAFASILTKKYIKEFRPASARLRPCKRRGKTLIRRSCAVRPSPRRSVFSHRNSHEQPCAESLPFSARTRPFRGSSVRFQPDDLRKPLSVNADLTDVQLKVRGHHIGGSVASYKGIEGRAPGCVFIRGLVIQRRL